MLNIKKVKSEDLVVTILSRNKVKTTYRFFGVRHSAINLGFKIDFGIEQIVNKELFRLRDVMHINYAWLIETHRLKIWQQLCTIIYDKLNGTSDVDEFYHNILDEHASIWGNTNPKRLAITALIKILEFEGRLDNSGLCRKCKGVLSSDATIVKGFALMHPKCSFGDKFNANAIQYLLNFKNSVYLNDEEIDKIWHFALQGFAH